MENPKKCLQIVVKEGLEGVQFSNYIRLFLALEGLYKCLSGDSIVIEDICSFEEVRREESKFEQHGGTPWANMREELIEIPYTHCIPRNEVYGAVAEFAKPEMADKIRNQLDNKYPKNFWGDNLPFAGAFHVLINENLENLVLKDRK